MKTNIYLRWKGENSEIRGEYEFWILCTKLKRGRGKESELNTNVGYLLILNIIYQIKEK